MTSVTYESAPAASSGDHATGLLLLRRLQRSMLRVRAASEFDCIEPRLREDAGLRRRDYLAAAERPR